LKLVVGVSGASGAVYGVRLLEKLRLQADVEVHLILSRSGEKTLFLETGKKASELKKLVQFSYALEDISGRLASGSFRTDGMVIAPFAAIEDMLETCVAEVAQTAGVPVDTARKMVRWHGPAATRIARMVVDERLRQKLCEHCEHIVAEALHALWFEHAITLGDVLLRRVPVALGPCWSAGCTQLAAKRIGAVAGWDEKRVQEEVERFEKERKGFLQD